MIFELACDKAGLAQPKHWSVVLSAIRQWLRVTGSSVNRPTSCGVMPGLPTRELPVTVESFRAS